MKQYIKYKFLVLALLSSSIFGYIQINAPAVNAQNSSNCSTKVNQKECLDKIKSECSASNPETLDRCQNAAAQKFKDVDNACKDKIRPQACHAAIEKECGSKTGNKKTSCVKDRAADFKAKSADAGNAPNSFFDPSQDSTNGDTCGNGKDAVETKFNFGCLGADGPSGMGPIEDFLYSLVRFMSAGVGIVVVIFIILAGIQYSSSEGNPEATQDAKNKIRNAVIGLMLYLFTFSLVQFLVPGGVFAGSIITPDTIVEIRHIL